MCRQFAPRLQLNMMLLILKLSSVFLLSSAVITDTPTLPIAPIIQNLTYNEYYYQPTVYFIFEVNLESFQEYIDPRFRVVSPYNNGSAYIVMQVGNMTAYANSGGCYHCVTFTYLQSLSIYTMVEYNDRLYREVLATSFNFTPPAIVGNLYQNPPYGSSQINPGLTFSANNGSGLYEFSSSTTVVLNSQTNITAALNFSLNFKNSAKADYTNPGTLAGFYLGNRKNESEIQSLYRKGSNDPSYYGISTATLTDMFFTKVINCTDLQITSTYIQTIIGQITGLEETNPVACYFNPYSHFYTVAVTPIQSQK